MNPYQSPQCDDRTRRGRVRRDYTVTSVLTFSGAFLLSVGVSIAIGGGSPEVAASLLALGVFFSGSALFAFIIDTSRIPGTPASSTAREDPGHDRPI